MTEFRYKQKYTLGRQLLRGVFDGTLCSVKQESFVLRNRRVFDGAEMLVVTGLTGWAAAEYWHSTQVYDLMARCLCSIGWSGKLP